MPKKYSQKKFRPKSQVGYHKREALEFMSQKYILIDEKCDEINSYEWYETKEYWCEYEKFIRYINSQM